MLAILDLVPKWLLAALLAAAAATSCKFKYEADGLTIEVQKAAVAAAKQAAKQAEEYAALQTLARETEQGLQTAMNDNQRMRDEQVKAVRVAASGIRDRLREQPTPQTSSGTAPKFARIEGFAEGSHGAELRTEAEPLVGEAERADTIRLDLLSCYAAYESARQALKPKD